MRVHVVTAKGEGWIMPKYGNALAAHLENTTHGHEMNPHAHVHIYLPYYNLTPNPKGFTVCYFTHYEEHPNFQHRRDQWKDAAKRADLRISMSQKYASLLERNGPTVAIPLPVLESQVGTLTPKQYRIGISTKHYPSDRKGKDLVAQLLADKALMQYIELVETKGKVSRDKMAGWYRSLDYYLCTSTVEGGPLGVLEAEICGVPTIVPAGVGWTNEFGRIFYGAGKYVSLRQTLESIVIPRHRLHDHNEAAWATKIDTELRKWL